MNLSVLFIFTIRIIFVPFAVTQSVPNLICGYLGSVGNVSYKLTVSEIPKRCVVIWSGYYFLDAPMDESDKNAVLSLASVKKSTYISVVFKTKQYWDQIMNSPNTHPFLNNIQTMEQFLKNYTISGIMFEALSLFKGDIKDYATKMNTFICKIKANVPSLKVGLYIPGYEYTEYGKKNLFDFSIVNSMVDFYATDPSSAGDRCSASTTNRYPMTLMENFWNAVSTSGMDKNKIILVTTVLATLVVNNSTKYVSYSEYCTRKDDPSQVWCADSMQDFYDISVFAKQHYKGIFLFFLDLDDYNGSCGCTEKFPVTNTYIDGWQSIPLTCCNAISGNIAA